MSHYHHDEMDYIPLDDAILSRSSVSPLTGGSISSSQHMVSRSMTSPTVTSEQTSSRVNMNTAHVENLESSSNNPLGISHQKLRSTPSILRVPVGSKTRNSSGATDVEAIASPPPAATDSQPLIQERVADWSMLSPNETLVGQASPPPGSRFGHWRSGFRHTISRLKLRDSPSPSPPGSAGLRQGDGIKDAPVPVDERYDDDVFHNNFGRPPSDCWSAQDIHQERGGWLSVTVLILSVYSTIMSGLWLFVAIVQPRWGHKISSKAGLQPASASLITALVAKTIEVSFVTVFVSFVGQVLTRRSFMRSSRGTTLAEMTMRSWVIQPGSLLTHGETISHAAFSALGAICLTATLAAMFYTSASDAMVAPKLMYGSWERRVLAGQFFSSYGNSDYVKKICPMLIDHPYAPESCMNAEFSGQSYRDLLEFMKEWDVINKNGTGEEKRLKMRPSGTALLYGNTSMTASWIETQHSNITAKFAETGRIINNVTMAMPHPGVYAAAKNPVNSILQPDELSGVGEYSIKAGVVSPAVNVMCVNMLPSELAPLVYTTWPAGSKNSTATQVGNQTQGPPGWEKSITFENDETGQPKYLNRTEVDDIFLWGPKHKRWPPVFGMYPSDHNIITNTSVPGDSIYLLGKRGGFTNYTLCQLRSWVSPNCSTHFSVSGTGGNNIKSHCEDPADKNSYLKSFPVAQGWSGASGDWKHLAHQWTLATDLNGGFRNNNASNAVILTQMALQLPDLSAYMPSMAEGLAAFAGSTLVQAAIGTPFVHWWEYTKKGNMIGDAGSLQSFNASVSTQEYTSGHINNWQGVFYVVLAIVFVLNVFCLGYILFKSGLVTDFTEPLNLFTLAVNSPPSQQLKGSCGGGPRKRDLMVPWRIAYAPSANHYFFQEASDSMWKGGEKGENESMMHSGSDRSGRVGHTYKRLSSAKGWF